MPGSSVVQLAAASQTRAGAWLGGLIVLGIIAAIVALAVTNSRTKQRLRRSDLEVSRLRAHLSRADAATASATTPEHVAARTSAADAYRTDVSSPADWFPDPTRRHEHRYWDGVGWTVHVADLGVASTE